MPVPNAYPELPEVPYKKTAVPMQDVIDYIQKANVPAEVKRAGYIWFKNESQGGQKGINNNYTGMQADSTRWPKQYDSMIVGTVVLSENQTKRQRRFIALKDFKGSVDFLLGRLQARGLYIGGTTHKIAKIAVKTPVDLARAYKIEWVSGDPNAKSTNDELRNFLSMYKQAEKYFPAPVL